MTTALTKAVFRESTAFVRDRGLRPLIVGLAPGNVILLRAKGMRRSYMLPMAYAYLQAVKLHVANEKAERAKARKARKGCDIGGAQ